MNGRHQARCLSTNLALVFAALALSGLAAWAGGPGEGAPAPEWILRTIDDTREVGYNVAVATDASTGHVYVSYYDGENGDLWLARTGAPAGNCGPSDTWECLLIDWTGIVGKYSSIAVGGPGPVAQLYITYHDVTNGSLKVMEATVDRGTGDLSYTYYPIEPGDPGAGVLMGTETSVDISGSGTAHIAYQVDLGAAQAVKYARRVAPGTGNCGELVGQDFWQCDQVHLETGIGDFIDLDIGPGGIPNIAFHTTFSFDTFPMVATLVGIGGSCNNSDAWQCAPIRNIGNDTGEYLSFEIAIGGVKHLAYHNTTTDSLEWARYVGSGGNCGPNLDSWQCDAIESLNLGGDPSGVALTTDLDGYPVIAYQNVNAGFHDLKIARPLEIAPWAPMGNCGPLSPTFFPTWICETLEEGSEAHSYADGGLDIDMNPHGQACVVYRDLFDPISTPVEGHLKVAVEPGLPFSDGFESGDTSMWTASVP